MRTKRIAQIIVAALMLTCLFATSVFAQNDANKKSYLFRGEVQAINQNARKLTVNGEEVKGWMEAMTMAYGVDNPDILGTLKVGDRIEAIVYDKDMTLHAVRLVLASKKHNN